MKQKDYTHLLTAAQVSSNLDSAFLVNPNQKSIVATNLAQSLSTTYALLALVQNAHWNIEGPHFRSLHLMFNDQYEDLFGSIDTIAELTRQLDVYVEVDLAKFVGNSGITNPLAPQSDLNWLTSVLNGYEVAEAVFMNLQAATKDFPYLKIQDFAIERQETISKAIWMMKSTLKGFK